MSNHRLGSDGRRPPPSAANTGFFAEQMREAKDAWRYAKKEGRPAVSTTQPRLLFAGTAADSGTTAVHLAFLAALKRGGETAQPFHAAGAEQEAVLQAYVSGRLPRLIDPWLYDADTATFLLGKHSENCRLATFEASGGFFDGLYGKEELRLDAPEGQFPLGSAAETALTLALPTVLILRPRGSRQSVLASLRGFTEWFSEACERQRTRRVPGICGVIFNEVAESIYPELKEYVESETGLRAFGFLPPLPPFSLKLSTRSLGDAETPAWARLKDAINILAETGERSLDIPGLSALADSAPALPQIVPPGLLHLQRETQALGRVRIAVALDRCFFSYNQDNLELLAESGAQLLPFSPLEDQALPADIDALYMGGVFCPEMLPLLSHKGALGPALKRQVQRQMPVWAEGQGAAYLCVHYFDAGAMRWTMAGGLPLDALAPRQTKDRLYSRAPLELGELDPWDEEYLRQTEDLDNPRGISTWQAPYCLLRARTGGMLAENGDELKALGDIDLLQGQKSFAFHGITAKRSVATGINGATICATGPRLLLYSRASLVLRFMRAAARYQDAKEASSPET